MRWTFSIAPLAALALLLVAGGGCTKMISADDFLAKYTTNIEVPDPDRATLPTRTFLGIKGDEIPYYYIRDHVPAGQGGGLLGELIRWRCPVSELPASFPQAYCPGDVIFDGRPEAPHTYLIQSYVPPSEPAAPQPAATQPATTAPAAAEPASQPPEPAP